MERERPSSQPPRDSAVDSVRGTLRDALGALGNLALLSGSARVGSKAIEGVLPDVLASCAPMREAARQLLAALAPWFAGRTAVQELENFMLPRIEELERELTERVEEPLRTPARIGLDRVLARLSGELDAAQALMELLEVAAHETPFPLQIPEILRQRLPAAPSGQRPQQRFTARLLVVAPPPELPLKPRTFAALVGALTEWVHERGAPTLRLTGRGVGAEIGISTVPAEGGEELSIWGYGVIQPTWACLEAAAGIAGIGVEAKDDSILLRVPVQR